MMSVEVLTDSGSRCRGAVCSVAGEIDACSAAEFQAKVLRAYSRFGTPVTVDLSGVRFIDCAGLNALLRIRARVFTSDSPGDLRLRGLTRQAARLLAVSGTAALFEAGPRTGSDLPSPGQAARPSVASRPSRRRRGNGEGAGEGKVGDRARGRESSTDLRHMAIVPGECSVASGGREGHR